MQIMRRQVENQIWEECERLFHSLHKLWRVSLNPAGRAASCSRLLPSRSRRGRLIRGAAPHLGRWSQLVSLSSKVRPTMEPKENKLGCIREMEAKAADLGSLGHQNWWAFYVFVMRLVFSGFISLNHFHSFTKRCKLYSSLDSFLFLSFFCFSDAGCRSSSHICCRQECVPFAFCFNGVQQLLFIFISGGMQLY